MTDKQFDALKIRFADFLEIKGAHLIIQNYTKRQMLQAYEEILGFANNSFQEFFGNLTGSEREGFFCERLGMDDMKSFVELSVHRLQSLHKRLYKKSPGKTNNKQIAPLLANDSMSGNKSPAIGTAIDETFPAIPPPSKALNPPIYQSFEQAFNYFNKKLFNNKLPMVVFTLQHSSRFAGYFCSVGWKNLDGQLVFEICINPLRFTKGFEKTVLSTLVHEMCHELQIIIGKPSRKGYHNKEFSQMMEQCGLITSVTGEPGGKKTGQGMMHYIKPGGMFERAFNDYCNGSWRFPILNSVDYHSSESDDKDSKPKNRNKIKYTCEACSINVWGKPGLNIDCGDCGEAFQE